MIITDITQKTVEKLPREVVNKLLVNEDYNEGLKRIALPLAVLEEPYPFTVRTVKTDKKAMKDQRRAVTGETYLTIVEVENMPSSQELQRIKFEGQSPNLNRRDQLDAYLAPFIYKPVKTDRNIATIRILKSRHAGGILTSDSLLRILEQEDQVAESLNFEPPTLKESIKLFIGDWVEFTIVGAWVRRTLKEQENAYALAKMGLVDDVGVGTGKKVRLAMCGPNSDEDHEFYYTLGQLRECYRKR